MATSLAPGSAVSAWTAAPEFRPPHPIIPTFKRSLPAACAVRPISRVPQAATEAAAEDFRKRRRLIAVWARVGGFMNRGLKQQWLDPRRGHEDFQGVSN